MAQFYFDLILHLAALLVLVGIWWKAAEMEDPTWTALAFIWSGIAAAVYLIMWWLLGLGWLALISGQISYAVAIALFRAIRAERASQK